MSPAAPLRPCLGARTGCKNLVLAGRCRECAIAHEQARRPAHITKFYSSKAWQNVRNMKRRINNLCEDCLEERRITPVQVVDHVLPLATHWELRLNLENLRSLCHRHHEAKTRTTRT